ncbi:MAG TPA: HupE/UreJ family protein [Acidimicrobiia bacterium]|nr:HupE/UreJ family protein [Acidimicrobiia bacterium]
MASSWKHRVSVVLAVFASLTLGVWAAPSADAHDFESSYLYIDVGKSELGGRVELPYESMRAVFGLDLDGSTGEVLLELEEHADTLLAYVRAHTAIGAAGEQWGVEFSGVNVFEDVHFGAKGYAYFPFEVDVPVAEVPQVLEFTFDPFLDELPDRSNLVLLRNDLLRGVIDKEDVSLTALDAQRRSASVDLGDASQWKNFNGSIGIGVDHIATGPDHILFIFVLVLPSVLVLQATWRPAPSFGTALWRVLKVVSMFTVAHSITFSLAGLDVLPLPPSQVVEIVIALSIAAAALHNLWPVLQQREWIIAFAFGLFHGMGFAGLVEALDVSRTTQLVSLLGRNVGIEIGQVVIVLVAFPALFILSRTVYYGRVFVAASVTLAGVSFVWAFERIVSVDVGLTDQIIRVVRWPRSLIGAIAVTLVALLLYERERRSGNLVPLEATVG